MKHLGSTVLPYLLQSANKLNCHSTLYTTRRMAYIIYVLWCPCSRSGS